MMVPKSSKEVRDISKIPAGLQLYTVRNELRKDFFGTLKKIADMGYKTVEFAGYYGDIPAIELKRALEHFGLKGVSSHVGIEGLVKQLYEHIEFSLMIGAKYIIIPCVPREYLINESELQTLTSTIRRLGQEIKRNGLQLGYHNHAFEFEKVGGKYLLDRLIENVESDLLQLELDLFWVKKAGLEPETTLLSYKDRITLIHVKDMDKNRNFTEVGRGVIDWPSIFAAAKDIGVKYYFVEQDFSTNPLESIKMSIDYLKAIQVANN